MDMAYINNLRENLKRDIRNSIDSNSKYMVHMKQSIESYKSLIKESPNLADIYTRVILSHENSIRKYTAMNKKLQEQLAK